MTRISLCLVIIVGILGLVGCSQVPVATKMVPSAFSMYKRDLPRSISIGKVYGCDPSLKSNKYKITDPVFKQALGDALNNSKLFQKAVYDDLGSNYVLEAELAYNEMKAGFGGHPMELFVRYSLYDQINGVLVWSKDIYSYSDKGSAKAKTEQAGRANILRLIQELSKLEL
ncbi:MAG TPA: hypothetical protein PKI63_04330 [Candidatus Cloacimonadota bacterium]|nr:hypothetical protein [Candidatus Cloacimonadota bacterium]